MPTARMAAVQHGSTATHPDAGGLAGTREDGDLHGGTRVDVLPPAWHASPGIRVGRCAGVKMAVGGVGAGWAAARWCGFAGWLRGLAAGVAWVWQGAGGCSLTPVFLSGTQARMQVWRRGLDLRVAHCCL